MIQMPSIRVNENLHIVLWLVKDLAWLMEFRLLGALMIAPTLTMAFFITWQCRAERRELVHAIAVILWILANSTWMIGDFYFGMRGHGLAQGFFIGGLSLLAVYYLLVMPLEHWRRNTRATNG
ncbi:MAG: hypothetical protein H6590_03655 [Flavobacteriales bacterium]|nr:hypothetical protein [Flavobacteriales bacterium]MCB9178503.1 hypothetical protein [Flavobacteriales bacterium]